jgi:phospholipid/cholesterol/gamma-HCH transport system substrate-binding protein
MATTQKKKLAAAELKVGIVMTIAMILLAATILQQSWGINWFQASEKFLTYLPDVGGLKPGAPIWLAGIEIGKVRRVTIIPPETYPGNEAIFAQMQRVRQEINGIRPDTPNARARIDDLQDRLRQLKLELRFVEVALDIRKQYANRISVDSEVAIGSKGLIGDSFIEISPGTAGVPPQRRGEYFLIQGVRTTGFREIMTGANDVIANFGVLSEQFKNIAVKINPDKVGSGLAETITEMQRTLRQANATFAEATNLVKDLRQGQGTIGRLVDDPALYDRLNESLGKFSSLADRIQEGNGTISKLLNDSQIHDSMLVTVKKANTMLERVEQGEGTLGRLSKDSALYDSSRRAVDKFAGFVDTIDRGEGTLGKLLKDPSLYNNLNQSTAEVTKLIYDIRQDPKKYLTIRFRVF